MDVQITLYECLQRTLTIVFLVDFPYIKLMLDCIVSSMNHVWMFKWHCVNVCERFSILWRFPSYENVKEYAIQMPKRPTHFLHLVKCNFYCDETIVKGIANFKICFKDIFFLGIIAALITKRSRSLTWDECQANNFDHKVNSIRWTP